MIYYHYLPDANKFVGISISDDQLTYVPQLNTVKFSFPKGLVELYCLEDPLNKIWKAPEVHVWRSKRLKPGDFPSLSSFCRVPVFSNRAWEVLRGVIGDDAEALPIQYDESEAYYLIHPLRTLDCLDVENAKVTRFSDGAIMNIDMYAFRPLPSNAPHMFKMPPEFGGELIVDDVFRRAVEEHNLKGLLFPPLKMVST